MKKTEQTETEQPITEKNPKLTAAERRARTRRRLLRETRREYVLALIILVIGCYLAFRAFGLAEFGTSVYKKFHHQAPIESCPTTSKLDIPVDVGEYVGVSKALSDRYAANLIGDNLYPNNGLSDFDDDSYPSNFEHAETVDYSQLKTGTDPDGTHYLRVVLSKTVDSGVGKTWLPNFSAIKTDTPYYFSLEYRSDVRDDLLIQYQKQDGSFSYEIINQLPTSTGWRKIEAHFQTEDPNITGARILVSPRAMGQLDITRPQLRQLKAHVLDSGMISVAFDDGWLSVYQLGLPILNKYGIITTQYIVPAFAQTDTSEYMSMEQLHNLQQHGHEIGLHSYRHCDLTLLNDKQLAQDVDSSLQAFKKAKLNSPAGYAYPYGAYNSLTEEILRPEFSYVRASNDGYNDYYTDPSLLMVKSVDASTTTEQIKQWIDYAHTHKVWLTLLYHRLSGPGDYSATVESFDAQMSAVKNSGLPVKTVSQALAQIK